MCLGCQVWDWGNSSSRGSAAVLRGHAQLSTWSLNPIRPRTISQWLNAVNPPQQAPARHITTWTNHLWPGKRSVVFINWTLLWSPHRGVEQRIAFIFKKITGQLHSVCVCMSGSEHHSKDGQKMRDNYKKDKSTESIKRRASTKVILTKNTPNWALQPKLLPGPGPKVLYWSTLPLFCYGWLRRTDLCTHNRSYIACDHFWTDFNGMWLQVRHQASNIPYHILFMANNSQFTSKNCQTDCPSTIVH